VILRYFANHPHSAYNSSELTDAGMANNHKRDQWLQDIEARQRNIVFPDTVKNEARFWRNLSKRPLNTSTKIGLAFLAVMGWGVFARLFFATIQTGETWLFVLAMLLVWGPTFGVIAWATRRSLRNIHKARRGR
jgi:hypothetical protein